MPIGIGLLGLGTVGAGVAEILLSPQGRHPLVADLELRQVAVRDLNRPRPIPLSNSLLTTDPAAVVANPDVDLVVEVMGGLEPARSLILAAIEAGKAVVTANKAVIARHGAEIASAAAGAVSVKPSMVLLLRVLVVDTLSRSRKSHIGVPFIFIIFFFIVVEQNALFRTRFTRANISRWN